MDQFVFLGLHLSSCQTGAIKRCREQAFRVNISIYWVWQYRFPAHCYHSASAKSLVVVPRCGWSKTFLCFLFSFNKVLFFSLLKCFPSHCSLSFSNWQLPKPQWYTVMLLKDLCFFPFLIKWEHKRRKYIITNFDKSRKIFFSSFQAFLCRISLWVFGFVVVVGVGFFLLFYLIWLWGGVGWLVGFVLVCSVWKTPI